MDMSFWTYEGRHTLRYDLDDGAIRRVPRCQSLGHKGEVSIFQARHSDLCVQVLLWASSEILWKALWQNM